jgi:thiazole synthase
MPATRSTISCAGLELSPLWHCFGNHTDRIGLEQANALLDASGTNVLPINTHLLAGDSGRDGLRIGFGDVTYDRLRGVRDVSGMVKMLNINLLVSARAAVRKARMARDVTGEHVLKLEVLNPDLATSNDEQLVRAVAELRDLDSELVIMPLLSADLPLAAELVELGCPLLRVMGGSIGSGTGIRDRELFREICELEVPVVLDGGVGSPDDVRSAFECGASGVLVNSALFGSVLPPHRMIESFAACVDELAVTA